MQIIQGLPCSTSHETSILRVVRGEGEEEGTILVFTGETIGQTRQAPPMVMVIMLTAAMGRPAGTHKLKAATARGGRVWCLWRWLVAFVVVLVVFVVVVVVFVMFVMFVAVSVMLVMFVAVGCS